jgi:hypothetical protein
MTFKLFTSQELAIVCPTKDQPKKVEMLLKSMAKSYIKPAQIIIAYSGQNLNHVTKPFKKQLNCICLQCPQSGQVLQRSYAHKHLRPNIRLIIHLDDDISLDPNALGQMLDFWNTHDHREGKPLAGVSFNLTNIPYLRNHWLRKLFFLQTHPKGYVSIAGYASPYCPASTTHDTEWLLGGATAWSRDVIDKFKHPIKFPTRWAVCEDLIYSFPLRKTHKMKVFHEAKARHNDTYSLMSLKQGIFHGASSVIMRYHFVQQNKNLSFLAFLWMSLGLLAGNLLKGINGSSRHLGVFLGGMRGLTKVIINHIFLRDSKKLASNLMFWKK